MIVANAGDTKRPTPMNDVWAAIYSERDYQLLKWGYRQQDGTFTEATHNDSDWVGYIGDYTAEAKKAASRTAGVGPTTDSIRKVAAMIVNRFERKGIDRPALRALVEQATPDPDELECIMQTVLRVQKLAEEAEWQVLKPGTEAELHLSTILRECVYGLSNYGVEPRDITSVTNGRDNQPAKLAA